MQLDKNVLEAASKAKEENLKKGLSFEEWREIDSPGWFLSKESPESLFDRYVQYVKEYGFNLTVLN